MNSGPETTSGPLELSRTFDASIMATGTRRSLFRTTVPRFGLPVQTPLPRA